MNIINLFKLLTTHTRLVGFEERDRDCCLHSVTVRVDMPTFKTDCNTKFLL